MRLKLLGGVALAAACAASASWAEDGWYGAIDAGVHQPRNITGNSVGVPSYEIKTENTNAIVLGKIGYRFSPWIRLEFEGGPRPANLHGVSTTGTAPSYLCDGGTTLAFNPATGSTAALRPGRLATPTPGA